MYIYLYILYDLFNMLQAKKDDIRHQSRHCPIVEFVLSVLLMCAG